MNINYTVNMKDQEYISYKLETAYVYANFLFIQISR